MGVVCTLLEPQFENKIEYCPKKKILVITVYAFWPPWSKNILENKLSAFNYPIYELKIHFINEKQKPLCFIVAKSLRKSFPPEKKFWNKKKTWVKKKVFK